MNIIVVGLGSMGLRRIRLIQSISSDFNIIGIDPNEAKRNTAEQLYGIITYPYFHNVDNIQYFAVFVSSPPLTHENIIKRALEHNAHVFSEINIQKWDYTKVTRMAQINKLVLFLSSTLLYRKDILKIKEVVDTCHSLMTYNYHIGQYLPDWHPWEDYTTFFAAKKETNACREILALELPWLIDTFGEVVEYSKMSLKITDLSIDYPDSMLILIKHASGTCGILQVDVVSRKCERDFRLIGESLNLRWDGTPNGLFIYDSSKKVENLIMTYELPTHVDAYNSTIIEDAYYEEIKTFFAQINGQGNAKYTFENDSEIIELINKIEGI